MDGRRFIAGLFCLVLTSPAAAERLRFDGVFTSNTTCSGRACMDSAEQTVSIPFSFAVDLRFDEVTRTIQQVSSSTQYIAPRPVVPNLLLQHLSNFGLSRDAFLAEPAGENIAVRNNVLAETYRTARTFQSLGWQYGFTQGWGVSVWPPEVAPPLASYDWGLDLSVSLQQPRDYTPEQVRQPVSFAELVGFLDQHVTSAPTIPVLAAVRFESQIGDPGPFPGMAASELRGLFRMTIQCRTPSGMSGLLASVRGS